MAPRQADPLDIGLFWRLLSRLVGKLMEQHAHAEVVLIMQEGKIRQVRINRSYLPANLPEV